MRLGTRATLLWPGMILAGAALGLFVFLSWPEPTFRLVRLPYGESMPKTPAASVERPQPARTVKAAPAPPAPAPAVVSAPAAAPEPEAERELAAVEPEVAEPAKAEPEIAEPAAEPDGPVPAAEDDGYVESAEELGARPLPGMDPDGAAEEPESSEPLLGSLIGLAPGQ